MAPAQSAQPPSVVGAVPPQEAVLFDMDGVVTDTATLHAAAWQGLFDEVLADPRTGAPGTFAPFDIGADYRAYVDGRPREDGVRAFLTARGIDVPGGSPDDPAGAWTAHGLGNRKNELFGEVLARDGVRVFPGTVDLLRRLRAGGVPLGLVTASRNARRLLDSAELTELFDVIVDGQVALDEGLPGKPEPAVFLRAAELLGVEPRCVAVVEDAVAGVRSASRGGFGLVVGVARNGDEAELETAGADVVVGDVAQLDLGQLRADAWTLVYAGFDPAHEGTREALTTLANGYLGTRGAAPESAADDIHYPGTYLAGLYNRLVSTVHGREREDESMVNAPNWLVLDVATQTGTWWSDGGLEVSDERRELDLRRGLLTRTATLTDTEGRRLRLRQRRLVSMARPHLAGLETTLVADGWSGQVRVRSGIDAGVVNDNVVEYDALAKQHLRTVHVGEPEPGTLLVEAQTTQSEVRIATAARTSVRGAATGAPAPAVESDGDLHAQVLTVDLRDCVPVTFDKTVAVTTSRDHAQAHPRLAVLDELRDHPAGFRDLLSAHAKAWDMLWRRFGVELDADTRTQLVLNLHVFHLLQALSPHTADLDAGVTARGLHGEGYRGHVFWDELFALPVLTAHLPEVSRGLLEYRWRRLPAARRAARAEGLPGAMFPWQSGSDGREETPPMLFNTRSGRWMPDNSFRQRHVGLAVAHNAWEYFTATGDVAWLARRGVDLLVEVARFFAGLARYDADADRFHVDGVMGPDEYHDGYPDAPGDGLRDPAYNNVLIAWICSRAVEVLNVVDGREGDDVRTRLAVRPEEVRTWDHMSRRMAVPFMADGVIAQFAGYEDLRELDWDDYRRRYGNIGRLDLILEAEGDTTNRYRLAKQADVLMLVYLLGPDGLRETLDRLGYPTSPQTLRRTVDFYLARTAHGSTLSRVVHSSVLARMEPSRGWRLFTEALSADLDDTQGGTTREGIHLGAMAGTIDIVTRAFAGFRTEDDVVVVDPVLPPELRGVGFSVLHRGRRVEVALDADGAHLRAEPVTANGSVPVRVAGTTAELSAGVARSFDCGRPEQD